MVFGPTPMRRLYLAVPIEYEDQVLKTMGHIGTVHIIRELQPAKEDKSVFADLNARFDRLNDKLDTILTKETTKTLTEPTFEPSVQKDLSEVEQSLAIIETEFAGLSHKLEDLEKNIKDLDIIKGKLTSLSMNGLRADEIGVFKHIFVTSGFMKSALTTKLAGYLKGTSVISLPLPSGRSRENLVILAGLKEDHSYAQRVLKLLNYEEIILPTGINPDPEIALNQIQETITLNTGEIKQIKQRMLEIKVKASSLRPYVAEAAGYEEAKGSVIRTQTKSLIHGWVPMDEANSLKTQMEQVVPKEKLYMKLEQPKVEDTVPVEYKSTGVVKAFEMFTNLQGVPNYFEINPTLIYMFLYVIMFGMMFGDIGAGIVLIAIGALLTQLKSGFLAFSSNATKNIAVIFIGCGCAATFFGFLYGIAFLVHTPWPHLIPNPLIDVGLIIVIALVFGVAQIILSLILNIINMARRRDFPKLVLGGRGLIALIFYCSGVVVGYAFVMERNLTVFFSGSVTIFSAIALASLVLIFFSPLIESLAKKEGAPVLQKVLEGFGESLESFISFIANSVSYIRLAAFAIAHEAIAIAAVVLGGVLGNILALVLLNILDFLVEGFASFIQSLRLMYYEFSTRFLLKDGIPYKPFKIGLIRIKT